MYIELSQCRRTPIGQRLQKEYIQSLLQKSKIHSQDLQKLLPNHIKTPFFALDRSGLKTRVQQLHDECKEQDFQLLLAVKSCNEPSILKLLSENLDGFDVSNHVEYAKLPQPLRSKTICFTAPKLEQEHINLHVQNKQSLVTVDSTEQFNQFVQMDSKVPYLLRLRAPSWIDKKDPGYVKNSRFGFTPKDLIQLKELPELQANPPQGFHIHHGGELNASSTYISIAQSAQKAAKMLKIDLKCVNLGGGWHRVKEDSFSKLFQQLRNILPQPIQVFLEPGKWHLQGNLYAYTQIVNHSFQDGQDQFTLDLSSECHLKWSNPSLLLQQPKELASQLRSVLFLGRSCYERDVIGRFAIPYENDFYQEAGLHVGSKILLSQLSSYSLSWNTSFNGIPKAPLYISSS